jgi:hypothetical protein
VEESYQLQRTIPFLKRNSFANDVPLKVYIRACMRSILEYALWALLLSMFLYFNCNFVGGSFFLYFAKTCLSISSGGLHKRRYHFCTSVATAFLRTGVRTLIRRIPTTTHLLHLVCYWYLLCLPFAIYKINT